MSQTYTILHTNDFHNKLTEAQANTLRQTRASLGDTGLLLDAGDAIASGNITFRPGGEAVLDLMNAAGYDVMTVGNREFHFTSVGFHAKVSRAKFPVLCANVNLKSEIESNSDLPNKGLPVLPFQVFTLANEFKVAVFGVTVPMITRRMKVAAVSSFLFEDPLEVAMDIVKRLHETVKPDLLVCLSHIGARQDRVLAEKCPAIDLIVGGHSHVVMNEGERVNQSLLVQAGSHGRFYGVVDIRSTLGGRPILSARLVSL